MLHAAAARAAHRRQAADLARILKALADPTRLRLVSMVAAHEGGEACVCDLTEPLGLTQPTISHHLKILVDAGIFTRDKRGVWAYYALVPQPSMPCRRCSGQPVSAPDTWWIRSAPVDSVRGKSRRGGLGMRESVPPRAAWTVVDEGWGRRAADFATLSEPYNCREYVVMHHRLGIDEGDRLLDVACGSGLALELARLRGAVCAGLDASQRLVAVARDRNPAADIRVGDMHALPWDDATFDVVTSFRGVWGTTADAVGEIRRVLVPGGRVGLTVWGHLKASPGFWSMAPFSLAAAPKVENQAAMVRLGRPGAGEEMLARYGFVDIERIDVRFVSEFADPQIFARAMASTGPGYEAIQNVGEVAFAEAATNEAMAHLRDGLPLRAELALVGYLARTPRAG